MRSMLYVPADKPAMLAKARTRSADAVVVDLEDAVSLANKGAAREIARQFLADPPDGPAAIWVRVNNNDDLDTDLDAALSPNLTGIVLAKASNVDTLDHVDEVIGTYEASTGIDSGSIAVMCLIESALGVRNAHALACHPRTRLLALGEADLGADLGIPHDADDATWGPIRLGIVLDSAAAGVLPPVGPVETDFHDAPRLRASTSQLAIRGFGGRQAIHPAQIDIINDGFTPTAAAIAAARDVIDRFSKAVANGDGVVVDADGRMVDEAVIRHARRIVGDFDTP